MTDPTRNAIYHALPDSIRWGGKTIAGIVAITGLDARVVRTQLRAMERSGLVDHEQNERGRNVYARRRRPRAV